MIGDRNSRGRRQKPNLPRMIVKRSRTTVGETRPRTIVTRPRGVVEGQRAAAIAPTSPRSFALPRRILVLGGTIVTFAALVGGGIYAYLSPIFRVDEIRVDGTSRVDATAVAQRAGLTDQSMFTADLESAQKAITSALPLVKSVTIERDWPNTVHIVISERQSWGTWEQSGAQYSIDRDGVVLGLASAALTGPVIKSSEQGSRLQGDRVDYQAVDAAAEIYAKLPQVLGTSVTEVDFLAGKGVQVSTADGQTALLGDSSSIGYKLAAWAAVARQAEAQRLTYTTIDLRFGNRPVLQ